MLGQFHAWALPCPLHGTFAVVDTLKHTLASTCWHSLNCGVAALMSPVASGAPSFTISNSPICVKTLPVLSGWCAPSPSTLRIEGLKYSSSMFLGSLRSTDADGLSAQAVCKQAAASSTTCWAGTVQDARQVAQARECLLRSLISQFSTLTASQLLLKARSCMCSCLVVEQPPNG